MRPRGVGNPPHRSRRYDEMTTIAQRYYERCGHVVVNDPMMMAAADLLGPLLLPALLFFFGRRLLVVVVGCIGGRGRPPRE